MKTEEERDEAEIRARDTRRLLRSCREFEAFETLEYAPVTRKNSKTTTKIWFASYIPI